MEQRGGSTARQHVAALLLLTAVAPVTLWSWIGQDRMPPGDHAGYIASILEVRDRLVRYGPSAAWIPDQFGGTSHFLSDFKELLSLPLVTILGPLAGFQWMLGLSMLAGALGLYAVLAVGFRAPAAGLLAGYAYGFGAIACHRSALDGHLDVSLASALFPAILAAAENPDFPEIDSTARQAESLLDTSWEHVTSEIEKSDGLRIGTDLSIVSVGEASRSGERAVRVPLVLGDADGNTARVALTIQLDPLMDED